ncbi:MAG: NADH-quinone oxidoreductase subunit M [bacterium]|nr:NADH-quinone oxidoreductase subunit M [bacterium]
MELTNLQHVSLLAMVFLPIATALLAAFAQPVGREGLSRWIALAGSILTLLISLRFVPGIVHDPGAFTASVNIPWIENLNISLLLGLDGLSGSLVILTNLLVLLSILGSWTAIQKRQKEFYFFLLLLQSGILGTFLALDLVVFYIFWELMLVPLYFLIGIFGSGRRVYATMKFFLYTMAGSVLMLLGILTLYFQSRPFWNGQGTFDVLQLTEITARLPSTVQMAVFAAFMLAFAIKVPLFPLHTWLPDAHTEAPTAGSVILAGVLLKTGVYGMMRFCIPMFPAMAVQAAPLMMTLAVVAIIYGALTAFAQTDMKRLVAYSSVSHMGFIVLGIFAFQQQAVTGAALQMLNHGISTGGLFLCVGYLYERRHTREMGEFGGLAHNLKIYAVLTGLMVLSSVGLPGLNGFVGEFLILLGSYKVWWLWAVAAATGVILAACYLLRMMQLTFFGALDKDANKSLNDLNLREAFTLAALLLFAFWIGLYPIPFTRALDPASATIVRAVETPETTMTARLSAPAAR